MCSNAAGAGRRPLKVGTAPLAVSIQSRIPKTLQGSEGISRGCSQTPSLPALCQGRSPFGWDMWCDAVHRCSKINASLPACPNPPLAQEWERMRGLLKMPNDF